MIESHDYCVELVGAGDKRGWLTAEQDGLPELEVASPPEFGGPRETWSPEHLLVASVSSCLMTTFRSIAIRSGLDVLSYDDRAVGHLQRGPDGLYSMDRITLRPRIVVSPDSKLERAERIIHKADRACLISRSISAEVVVEPDIRSLSVDSRDPAASNA